MTTRQLKRRVQAMEAARPVQRYEPVNPFRDLVARMTTEDLEILADLDLVDETRPEQDAALARAWELATPAERRLLGQIRSE